MSGQPSDLIVYQLKRLVAAGLQGAEMQERLREILACQREAHAAEAESVSALVVPLVREVTAQ